MLLLDLTHTAHTGSLTGIQRVTRSLWKALGSGSLPVCHDPHLRDWRPLEGWEIRNLSVRTPAARRGASWPLVSRVRGTLRRFAGGGSAFPGCDPDPAGRKRGLIEPEIFSPAVAKALPPLFARAPGPRVALFYDAIALTHPELTPSGTVARFPGYLRELLAFDGIAAISEESRDALLGYWRWLGARGAPPVVAIPLALSEVGGLANRPLNPTPGPYGPTVLSVGTLEGRKNHLALLDACEILWARGLAFELRLIGMAQSQTGRNALSRIADLRGRCRPVRYEGPADEVELERAYGECAFTVYPSLGEGFGLPVIESLGRGRACVCLGRGALGEAARGGGCLALDSVDAGSLAEAIARLLTNPAELARLENEAAGRKFKTWNDYARELTAWMDGLEPSREPVAVRE
jgi:glycosyltransferase involved in cell wall biosynthesis